MALAQSLPKGQFPVSCKLCMTSTRISWKCQECDILMCNPCKETKHPNIKNAKNHKVVDIKTIGQECQHRSRDCVMYCKSCDQFGCPLCIVQHNGHELAEISEGLQIHTERLKKGQSQMKNHLDVLTKRGVKIEDVKKSEKVKYMETKKQIQAHNKELKKQVDQYTEKLIKELDKKWKIFTDSFEKEESQVVTLKQNKKDKNQQVEKILGSKDLEKIFEESKKVEKSLQEKLDLPEIEVKSMPTFMPGEISQYQIGVLQDISNISIKISKEISTDITNVFFMSSSHDDDSLWISEVEKIQKINPDGNKLQPISTYDMRINGIAVTPSNLVLLANGSVLKQISSTGEITDSVYSLHSLIITAVHVTKDFKVIVGTKSRGKNFPVSSGSREVIVMDKDGKIQERYEFDNYENRLFTYPKDITTTKNGNICVVDQLSADENGRIVVLGSRGHVINIYTGTPGVNTKDNPFCPTSVATTPSDNLIIPEKNTYISHILNNNGHYITCIKGGDVGIYHPFSVACTTSGKTYIGCTAEGFNSNNAKLFEVKLVGF